MYSKPKIIPYILLNREYLSTVEGDEYPCITLESLDSILKLFKIIDMDDRTLIDDNDDSTTTIIED